MMMQSLKFKIMFLLILVFLTSTTSVFAQTYLDWRQDVRSFNKGQVEMNNGRRYLLEKGAVTEFPDLEKSDLKIKNVFDFENTLVFHVDLKGGDKLAVTPFGQIPTERIQTVREIGCFIVQRGGDMNAVTGDKEPYDFAKKNCQSQKVTQ